MNTENKAKTNEQTFNEFLGFVRTHSPFYKKLYSHLPQTVTLEDLPLVTPRDYKNANTLENNQILTSSVQDGFIFKSGGTTSEPKYTYFSKEEWIEQIQVNAAAISKGPLEKGDRVANMFFAGALHGAYLFVSRFLEESTKKIIILPIGGHVDIQDAFSIIGALKSNVIVGSPTTLMRFAESYEKNLPAPFDRHQINKIFFAAETFFDEQRKKLTQVFPNLQIYSLGYASNDGGILGYADTECGFNEHKIFRGKVIIEIIDEKTGEVIQEAGREGEIVTTNLFRRLMPTVRYPVGDKGMWIDSPEVQDRKFKVMGRSQQSIKVGPYMLDTDIISRCLNAYSQEMQIDFFQLIVERIGLKDQLTIRVAWEISAEEKLRASPWIIQKIEDESLGKLQTKNMQVTHPIQMEWVAWNQMEINPRTGKIQKIIDKRT